MYRLTTAIEIVLGVVILLVLVPVVAAVAYRLVVVRRDATSILVRKSGEDTWRYGAVRYSDTDIGFYRLLSLRFGADERLDRRTLELGPRRQPTGAELDVAEEGEVIVPFKGRDRRDRPIAGEVCLGPSELTGLSAWIEACSADHIRPRRRRR